MSDRGSGVQIEADVAIVGAGPCGSTLANLLGVAGVSTVVLDREPGVTPYPRAVAIDDESLRTLQTAGLVDQVLPDLIQNAPIRYHSSSGRVLAHIRPSAQPYGWPRRNLFFQPLLERSLRVGLDRFPDVRLLPGTEVTGLTRTEDEVVLTATGPDGPLTVRAGYVVGADGGRSFVRESVGIDLVGSTAPSRWLVVDVEGDALESLYSAVYCHPERPTMTIPLPYGYRRFEFKLLPGEDEQDIVRDERILGLLRPYYPGLPMPTIYGRRVYWHHSRIASTFSSGRVFLAGDAAHLQPPFFGQGMNSGLRDATNLAWKLAAVTGGRAAPQLLDTYDEERRDHAWAMVSFATRVGSMYQPRNRATEVVRDTVFRAVQVIPGAREYILQMKYKPAPRYERGVVVDAAGDRGSPVGRLFGQPVVEDAGGTRRRLDDVLGPTIAVLGLAGDPEAHLSPESRKVLDRLGATVWAVAPPRPGRRASTSAPADTGPGTLFDVTGAFRDIRLDRPQDEVLVLRPDRYVAAACPLADLDRVVATLDRIIAPPR
ncbi:bifunctional 3-(3-hydroxy-phenyl)propionate/3-hydroxycinnamic acid hydroxylase [Trujillonella humicola]|uniref:bifunctional 3-(3-hydroxy-phenyl)propionate/3-hydroxycinnamic acid hydroxylase n=1 Tax=Trujillonella humicola TaxID=3383699 RepID=UPI0039065F8B